MNGEETLKEVVRYWIEKATDAISAADDELKAGRLSFSVNRIYYACFYAVSAVLIQKRLRFKKHSVKINGTVLFCGVKEIRTVLVIFDAVQQEWLYTENDRDCKKRKRVANT